MPPKEQEKLRKEYVEDGVFELSLGDASYTDAANGAADWWLSRFDSYLASKTKDIQSKKKSYPGNHDYMDETEVDEFNAGIDTALQILSE